MQARHGRLRCILLCSYLLLPSPPTVLLSCHGKREGRGIAAHERREVAEEPVLESVADAEPDRLREDDDFDCDFDCDFDDTCDDIDELRPLLNVE